MDFPAHDERTRRLKLSAIRTLFIGSPDVYLVGSGLFAILSSHVNIGNGLLSLWPWVPKSLLLPETQRHKQKLRQWRSHGGIKGDLFCPLSMSLPALRAVLRAL